MGALHDRRAPPPLHTRGPLGWKTVASEPKKLTLLTYDYPSDVLERREPHREAHLARVAEWRESGRLLLAGAVGDPPKGAIFVFDCPADDVEEFAAGDPYSQAGLVIAHRVEGLAAVALPG